MQNFSKGGTNAPNIRVQYNVEIYKRLILRARNHNFHVFLIGKTVTEVHRIVIQNQNKIVQLFIAQLYI